MRHSRYIVKKRRGAYNLTPMGMNIEIEGRYYARAICYNY